MKSIAYFAYISFKPTMFPRTRSFVPYLRSYLRPTIVNYPTPLSNTRSLSHFIKRVSAQPAIIKPRPVSGRLSYEYRCYVTTSSPSQGSTPNPTPENPHSKKVLSKLKDTIIPSHENVYNIPNILTFSRIIASPFLGYLILTEQYRLAVGVFAIAGITDLLDGIIARRYDMKTFVGSIIDPAADKILVTITTVSLTIQGLLPVSIAAIILGRDAGLILSSFYYRYISLPSPKTFSRYWDFSIPSNEVRPTTISKVNTALQLLLIASSLTNPAFGLPDGIALTTLQYTVAITTIWSGLSYIFSKDAVKILHKSD